MLAAPGGRLVLMGNPDGSRTLSQDLYWRILRRQLTLTGTWNSSYGEEKSDWSAALGAMASGVLRTDIVVSHVMQGTELQRGLDIMKNKTEPFCKIVLKL